MVGKVLKELLIEALLCARHGVRYTGISVCHNGASILGGQEISKS